MNIVSDPKAAKHGLSESLRVPIAARSIKEIETYVGTISKTVKSRSESISAFLVKPHVRLFLPEENIPLWKQDDSRLFAKKLHPDSQIWVHVDYEGYRKAYLELCSRQVPSDFVIDHIKNRKVVRMAGYSHPYLRLCAVSAEVNTSSGGKRGPEGMEKDLISTLDSQHEAIQEAVRNFLDCDILYADPIDLIKMLNMKTGTKELPEVGEILWWFYPC